METAQERNEPIFPALIYSCKTFFDVVKEEHLKIAALGPSAVSSSCHDAAADDKKCCFPATMVWLVNMADTDRPSRTSTDASPPQPEPQESELVPGCGFLPVHEDRVLTPVPCS